MNRYKCGLHYIISDKDKIKKFLQLKYSGKIKKAKKYGVKHGIYKIENYTSAKNSIMSKYKDIPIPLVSARTSNIRSLNKDSSLFLVTKRTNKQIGKTKKKKIHPKSLC